MIAMVSAIEMPGHHQPNGLQMDERRVVDPHPERLVRAVADGVGRVLAARALDGARTRGPGAAAAAAAAWP